MSWNHTHIEDDRTGSFNLAHEIGHLFWLGEAYVPRRYRTAQDSTGAELRTRSREGWERNIMADYDNDFTRRERRGRPWVGWRQAREIAIWAYRALDPNLWSRETMTVSRSTSPPFFATRHPKRL